MPTTSLGKGEQLFEAMCAAGQEGIISKKADAPYRDARTKNWLKVKCTLRQEFVIIGWSESDKKGRGFRSLLLGLNEDGKLRYAGKVGTGFSQSVQSDLREQLDKLATDKGPRPGPPRRGARRALGEAEAGRRDRLRRVHRRQCRAPCELPRPARRQGGEGGGGRNAPEDARDGHATTSRSAIPTG